MKAKQKTYSSEVVLHGISQVAEIDSGWGTLKALWNLDPHHVLYSEEDDTVKFSVDTGDTWSTLPASRAGLVKSCHKCPLKPFQWK